MEALADGKKINASDTLKDFPVTKKKRVISIEEEVRLEARRKKLSKILIGVLLLLIILGVIYFLLF